MGEEDNILIDQNFFLLLNAVYMQFNMITLAQLLTPLSRQDSFWWNYANNCIVNEDVPEGKKGEADEEAEGTTFQKPLQLFLPLIDR